MTSPAAMIYIVRPPEAGEATARFAFDADDLLRKVAAGAPLADHAIWDCASPGELFGATPGAWRARRALRQQLIAVEALADEL